MQKMPPELRFIPPMECREVRSPENLPQGNGWQYEIKFDGYRCIAIKQQNQTALFSRNGKPFQKFPNVFSALLDTRIKSFILDGEIVALDDQGRPNFNALQRWGKNPIEVHFYVFDLLNLNGRALIELPLAERQKLLWTSFSEGEFIHFPKPLNARLKTILAKVKEFGFEGVIAKRRDSAYEPGKRSGAWVKLKLKQTDEFIVGGFIPSGNRIDELIIGKPVGDKLVYVASLDDGFIPATRRMVFNEIKELEASICPFANLPERKGLHRMDREKMRKAVWTEPKVVVEIAMNEWTPDRHLRHAEFKRLRPDKTVADVSSFPA